MGGGCTLLNLVLLHAVNDRDDRPRGGRPWLPRCAHRATAIYILIWIVLYARVVRNRVPVLRL